MMIARGLSTKPGTPDVLIIGITPNTIEVLLAQGCIELARPAGLEHNIHLVLADSDDALVQFMRDNGAANVVVSTTNAPTRES